jgi:hypothetical protein
MFLLVGSIEAPAQLIDPQPKVMTFGSGDPANNTAAPTGALTNSGWQFLGDWGITDVFFGTNAPTFVAVPISPRFFITAAHISGKVGDPFVYHGQTYTTVSYSDNLNNHFGTYSGATDLRIWKVDHDFDSWATLSTNLNEVGMACVGFGRGTERGDPFYLPVPHLETNVVTNISTTVYQTNVDLRSVRASRQSLRETYPDAIFHGHTMSLLVTNMIEDIETNVVTVPETLRGWKLGPFDGVLRWGTNVISAVYGTLSVSEFRADAGADEATFSFGDSGGPIFGLNRSTGNWDLIGVDFGSEPPFSITKDGTFEFACLFDKSGFWQYPDYYYPLDGVVKPTLCYFTRIVSSLSWIRSVLRQ